MLVNHSSDHPPFFLKGRGVNSNYLPRRGGESEKLKKGGGSLVQGQVFLKGGGGGGWNFSYLIKVYNFHI